VSLVSDALRKARQEAALRGSPKLGYVVAPRLVMPPRIARTGRAVLLVVGVALAAGLLGAAATWWLTAGRAVGPAGTGSAPVVRPSDGSSRAAHRVDAGAAATAAGEPSTGVGARAQQQALAEPYGGSGPGGTGASATMPEPQAPGDGSAAVAPPGAGPEQTATEPSQRGERSFKIDADLGYAKLHLDYLVYKPSAPFGRVNGQDVIVGTVVNGFVVEEIGADFIRLRDRRGPVVLRVH